MASTIAFYTGDGATTDFTVPFDYLAKKFVRVSLGVTILKGGDYGDTSKDYYFLDKTKVRLKVPPQEGEVLIIRRYTSATDRVVSFKDASVLKATDLDVSSVQTIHIAEEARDIINDALIKDKEGNWDAKGNRIVNVGTPVAESDAVTYGVYKTDAKGAYQAKLDAERARDRAILAETNAKNSEVNSKRSEDNAKLSEVTAQASAGTAVSASKHADAVMVENQAILNEAREIQTNVQKLDKSTKENATIATTKAEEAKGSAEKAKESEVNAKESEVNAKESEKVVTGIAGTIVPIAPEIKIVADNIEAVRTVAGLAPDFNKVINSVDTVTKLTVRAETAATKSEASATQAGESEANAMASEAMATDKAAEAKDWANKMTGTVDGIEYSAKYYANRAKTEGGQAVETAKAQALQQINTAKTTAIKEIGDKGAQQKALLDTQVAEATRQAKLAEASATLAGNEADAAKTSENNAKKYADSAASAVAGKLDKAVFDGFVDYGDLGNQ